MLKRSIYVALYFCLALQLAGLAQKRKEIEYSGFFDSYYYRGPFSINLGGGAAGYLGDIPTKLGTGFSLGAHYRVWPRTYFGLDLNYLMLQGENKDTSGVISVKNTVYEIIAYGRFNLIDRTILHKNDINRRPQRIRPYITLGIGAAYINPQISVTDTNFFKNYEEAKFSNVVLVIPASLGFAFYLSKRFSLLAEFGYRYTFTDGIDGLNKINTTAFDSYGTAMLKLQYSFYKFKKRRAKYVPPPEGYNGGGGSGGSKAPKDSTLDDPILPPGAPAPADSAAPAAPTQPQPEGDGGWAPATPPTPDKPKELTEEEKKKQQEEKEQQEWENSWKDTKPQPADKKKSTNKAPAKPKPAQENSGW